MSKPLGLLSVVAALFLPLAAQPIPCTASVSTPAPLRSEGVAELIGHVFLSCSGNAAGPIAFSLTLSANTSVTSRVIAPGPNITEALATTTRPSGFSPQDTPAMGVQVAANAIQFSGTLNAGGSFSLVLSNVRINVAQLQGAVPQIYIAAGSGLIVSNQLLSLAPPQPAQTFTVSGCDGSPSGQAFSSSSALVNPGLLFTSSTPAGNTRLGIRFTERAVNIYRPRIDPNQDGPFTNGITDFNSESGVVDSHAFGPKVGIASQGTRLFAQFNNVPSGVRIFVSTQPVAPGTVSSQSLQAQLVNADSNGAGGDAVTPTGTGICNAPGRTLDAGGLAEIPLQNGAGTATWEVSASDPASMETAVFAVYIAYGIALDTASFTPPVGVGTADVIGSLAPLDALGVPSGSAPPVPRFQPNQDLQSLFTIVPASGLFIATNTPLPPATQGILYQLPAFTLSGGTPPFVFSPGSPLPPALQITSTGEFGGTPVAPFFGNAVITIQVADSSESPNGPSSKRFELPVNPGITIVPQLLPNSRVGASYSQLLSGSGGQPPYSWSVADGALPPGVTLTPTGFITGTPSAEGIYEFPVAGQDAPAGVNVRKLLSIVVFPAVSGAAPLQISSPAVLPSVAPGAPYSFQFQATGGVPPYTWTPGPGLSGTPFSLSSSGVLTGTSRQTGPVNFTVQVSDSSGQVVSKAFVLTVTTSTITISPPVLSAPASQTPYSATLTASGGVAPYTWALSSGALPSGLVLSPGGVISGTTAAIGTFNFAVAVVDARFNTATQNFTFTIAGPPFQIISGSPLPPASAGAPYLFQFQSTPTSPPGTWSVSAGALPPGLSLSPSGLLSGQPTAAGPYAFTIQVVASTLSATKPFTLQVNPSVALIAISTTTLPAPTPQVPYLATLGATGGVPPFTWTLTSGGLPAGLTLSTGGVISGNTGSTGLFQFGVTVTDTQGNTASRLFTFTVQAPPNQDVRITTTTLPPATTGTAYSQILAATGGTGSYTWSTPTPLPAGLSLSSAGVLSGIPSVSGRFPVALQVSDGRGGDSANLTLSIAGGVLAITTTTLPGGPTGSAYSGSVVAIGGSSPYTFSVTAGSLPTGLAISPAGAITGTPSAPGTFTFTVQASDAAKGTATQSFTVVITAVGPSITTASVPNGIVGATYSAPLAAAGGTLPYVWSISAGAPPDGLTIDPASGTLSGIPTKPGNYTFTVQVTDKNMQSGTNAFSVSIAPAALAVNGPVSLPNLTTGANASVSFTATGGVTPYTWTISAGSAPPGISLATNGTLSGTVTGAPGNFSFTVQVKDAAGSTATRDYTVKTFSPLAITTGALLGDGVLGTSYSQALIATGGLPPYKWSSSGNLPAGLALDASGNLSGVPSAAGLFNFTAAVADANGATLTRAFTISVRVPVLNGVSIGGVTDTSQPAQQPNVTLTLGNALPVDATGTLTITFTPNAAANADDPSIQFSTGGRVATFKVPANTTNAAFTIPNLGIQTGTVAGTIVLTTALQIGTTAVTCNCDQTKTIVIPRSIPVITSVKVTRVAGGLSVQVIGYSTTRELSQAVFNFSGAPGANLQTTALTIPLTANFATWFSSTASAPFGGQFLLTQQFTVAGDTGAISSVSVVLTNAVGQSQSASATVN